MSSNTGSLFTKERIHVMLTPEQKEKRIGKITSSVAAACLGLDKRKSQIQAKLEITGKSNDDDKNKKACDRGDRLEKLILQYPADKHGLEMVPAGFRNNIKEWAGDSADAVYSKPGIFVPVMVGEGKSASLGVSAEYGEEGTDEVPQHTLIQSHWHLIHWPEVDICVVPVLVGGYRFEFREYMVKRDDELEGLILQDLEKWHHDYIVKDKWPDPDHRDTEWLVGKYPVAKFDGIPSNKDIEDLAKKYNDIREWVGTAEKRKDSIANKLKAIVGEHDGCKADWGSVTWKNTKCRDYVDWEAIAKKLSSHLTDEQKKDIVLEHTVSKHGHRVFRVNVKRGENNV